MGIQIIDGLGLGKRAEVDSLNRLRTFSVTEAQAVAANERGDAYNLNTASITLTNASDTPVAYLKNNEDRDLIIEAVVIGIGPSTSGSGLGPQVTFIRNPTAGTTISNANNASINSNRNYGSPNTLTADWFKGATGETMTDGDDHILVFTQVSSRTFVPINEILPKGTAIGFKIDPPFNNTSMQVYIAILMYLHE